MSRAGGGAGKDLGPSPWCWNEIQEKTSDERAEAQGSNGHSLWGNSQRMERTHFWIKALRSRAGNNDHWCHNFFGRGDGSGREA